jgi:hypothetical protein
MKSAILVAITCCAIAGSAIGATPPPPQKKAVTPARQSAPPPSAVAKKGATVANTGTHTPAKTTPTKRYYARQPVRATYRSNYRAAQNSPTPDRYREIQDALAAKGYLKTPSSGVWDKDSMDAMQRFQKDQNLDPTGKLTARSLGALGLGPKTPPASSPDPTPTATPTPTTETSPFQ